jgi:hypothetical protein
MTLQSVTFLVKLDRLVERCFAFLKRANDLLEPRKGRFETQLIYVFSTGQGRL